MKNIITVHLTLAMLIKVRFKFVFNIIACENLTTLTL